MADFQAEHAALHGVAQAMTELVEGQRGLPLAPPGAGGEACGHPAFAEAFTGFCERWSAGIDALCDDATGMAEELGRAADAHREADERGAAALAPGPGPGSGSGPGAG